MDQGLDIPKPPSPALATREQWRRAWRVLLEQEKALTRARDQVNAARRALPWVRVEREFRFATPEGERDLAQLFGGLPQLIVYHFMLAPGWGEGCTGCSFLADHLDGTLPHLQAAGTRLVVTSRAPLAEIEAYRRRMGWRFPWVSEGENGFGAEFGVHLPLAAQRDGSARYNDAPLSGPMGGLEDLHGLSVFARTADGAVCHTYSCYARGPEELLGTFMLLDRTPSGRAEQGIMSWVRRHDEYAGPAAPAAGCCG